VPRLLVVPQIRIKDAAAFLGVSDDTVRRWVDSGALEASTDDAGRKVVDSYRVALLAREQARAVEDPSGVGRSARNRFVGLVTDVKRDTVMAQVELQCGPFRVVSLMSREAVDDLGLEPGSVAIAVVKSTTVIVETPRGAS
jgi:molybdopterin-binding protein